MKNILAVLVLGIALAGASFAQPQSEATEKPRIAIVEFTAGEGATEMTAEASRQLQASIVFELNKTREFDVVDVGEMRDKSEPRLFVVNAGDGDRNTAALRLGEQLKVHFVLIGTVNKYVGKDENDIGRLAINVRFIHVATGKVDDWGHFRQNSVSAMHTGDAAEMYARLITPAITRIVRSVKGTIQHNWITIRDWDSIQ